MLRGSEIQELCHSGAWSLRRSAAAYKTLQLRGSLTRHFRPHAMVMEKRNLEFHQMQTTMVLLSQPGMHGCRASGSCSLDYMCNERPLWIVTEVPRHALARELVNRSSSAAPCPKFRLQFSF
jgi:hypothetical protein